MRWRQVETAVVRMVERSPEVVKAVEPRKSAKIRRQCCVVFEAVAPVVDRAVEMQGENMLGLKHGIEIRRYIGPGRIAMRSLSLSCVDAEPTTFSIPTSFKSKG
jgi:hypothetical protein